MAGRLRRVLRPGLRPGLRGGRINLYARAPGVGRFDVLLLAILVLLVPAVRLQRLVQRGDERVGDVVDEIGALQAWIAANPGVFYAYLTPADWDTLSQVVGSVTWGTGTYEYSTAPTITFTTATGGGVTAEATVTIDGAGQIEAITVTNPGYYPNQPTPTATLSAPTTGTAPSLTVTVGSCGLPL